MVNDRVVVQAWIVCCSHFFVSLLHLTQLVDFGFLLDTEGTLKVTVASTRGGSPAPGRARQPLSVHRLIIELSNGLSHLLSYLFLSCLCPLLLFHLALDPFLAHLELFVHFLKLAQEASHILDRLLLLSTQEGLHAPKQPARLLGPEIVLSGHGLFVCLRDDLPIGDHGMLQFVLR